MRDTDRGADRVHVADRRRGRQVREQPAAVAFGRRRRAASRPRVRRPRSPRRCRCGRPRRSSRGSSRSRPARSRRRRAGPTTRCRTGRGSSWRTRRRRRCTRSTPEPPGPPGFVNSTPSRRPSAGRRARLSVMCGPSRVRPVERHRQRRALDRCRTVPDERAGPLRGRRRRARREQAATTSHGHERRERIAPARDPQRRSTAAPYGSPTRARRTPAAPCPYACARVPPERARRPGLPRGDAVRGRQLARRRRRGAAAARRAARATRDARATSRTGAAPATSRSSRSTAATSRSAPRGTAGSTADAPGYGFVADDVPELSIAVYPECRGQRVGSLLLGTLVSRARADGYRAISLSVAGDEPGPPAVRAARLRGRRRPDGRRPTPDRRLTMVARRSTDRARPGAQRIAPGWRRGPAGGEDAIRARPEPATAPNGDGGRRSSAPHTNGAVTTSGHAQAAAHPAPRSCSSALVVFVGLWAFALIYSVTAGGSLARAARRPDAPRVVEAACVDAQHAADGAARRSAPHATAAERAARVARRGRDPHRRWSTQLRAVAPDADDAGGRAHGLARRLAAPDRRPAQHYASDLARPRRRRRALRRAGDRRRRARSPTR